MLAYPPGRTSTDSPHILRTYANMILYMEVTHETTEITDPKDAINYIDIIKVISEIAHDQLVAFKDTNHEV